MTALMDSRFELRLSRREREALAEQADRHGLTQSQYLRCLIRTHDLTRAITKSGDVL